MYFDFPSWLFLTRFPPPHDFTGREDDLNELVDYYRCGENVGATITGIKGMGGIGKTVLAYKLAEKLSDCYPDGQILVDMKGTSDKHLEPTEAMAQIIHSYDPEAHISESESELSGLYCTKLHGKRALLLLDNAIDDKQILPLIPPKSCGLIVTSRREFTLPGMKKKDLDIMRPSDAHAMLITISDRIDNHAEKLSKLCGYLPLALRAAASLIANTRDLSPAEYVDMLQAERLG